MAKNRLIYGMVLGVMLSLVFLQEAPMTYLALYAVLILPFLSLLLAFVSRIRLEIREKQPVLSLQDYFTVSEALSSNYVTKGEAVLYKLNVKNNSFLPCLCAKVSFAADNAALDVDSVAQYFSVKPKESSELTVELSAKYRGKYEVGIQSIVRYDLLGLFRFKQKRNEKRSFTVVPRILPMAFLPLDARINDLASAQTYIPDEDYSIVSDLRKYQPTDSHKRIHWKASAKKNELISKNFGETERQSAVLCIDNTDTSLDLEDTMMEALASVMAYCNRNGYSVSLRYLGDTDTGFHSSFDYLYKEIANLTFQESDTFDDYFKQSISHHQEAMNLILFAQDVTERLLALIQSLRQSGSHVILFYFPDQTDGEIMKKLKEWNLCCIDFHTFSK